MSITVPAANIGFRTAPALSPADATAHQAASYVRPTPVVDVAQLLTDTANMLRSERRQAMSHPAVVAALLKVAGPRVSIPALRPAFMALSEAELLAVDESYNHADRLAATAWAISQAGDQ